MFEGKVAIVVGAGGAIGTAIVERLMAQGARVVAADIDLSEAQASGATAAKWLNVLDEPQIADVIASTVRQFGRLDILINNAALQTDAQSRADGDIEQMEAAIWDAAFAVNTRGAMLTCKHALPHLVKSAGAIVNVASNLGLQGGPRQAAYAASKAALIQLTRSIAASHGKRGVRCNAVAPGLTLTPKVKARLSQRQLQSVEDETLTPGLGQPGEIAAAVVFMASAAAGYITGHTLVVDGGTSSHVPGMPLPRPQPPP